MTREDTLRLNAKIKKLKKTGKPEFSTEAFLEENLYNTDYEVKTAWEDSGVLDNVKGTLDFGDDNGEW